MSWAVTFGWVTKAVPAVAVAEGCCVTASLEALAGLTAMPAETAEVKVPDVKVKVMVAALVTYRPLKVAMPLEGAAVWAVVVAFKFPPLVSVAVIAVAYE